MDNLALGIQHMGRGWDHCGSSAASVLPAGNLHAEVSLRLLLASIAGWKLNATAVDVVIPLSLVYVGVQGARGRSERLRVFGAAEFAFGLVYGVGTGPPDPGPSSRSG